MPDYTRLKPGDLLVYEGPHANGTDDWVVLVQHAKNPDKGLFFYSTAGRLRFCIDTVFYANWKNARWKRVNDGEEKA